MSRRFVYSGIAGDVPPLVDVAVEDVIPYRHAFAGRYGGAGEIHVVPIVAVLPPRDGAIWNWLLLDNHTFRRVSAGEILHLVDLGEAA